MKKIVTLNLNECVEYLRERGLSISSPTMAAGIEKGVFPFGVCIDVNGSRTFKIFKVLLDHWIEERAEEVESA